MDEVLRERLNQILPRLVSDELLGGRGLGNEIAFYVFAYPPEQELVVREHVTFLVDQIPRKKPDLRFKHVNLFDLVIEYLGERKLLDRAFEMQKTKGDDALMKALKAPLHPEKLARVFVDKGLAEDQDLVLLSGIGSAWPLIRSHTLLTNLHPIMGNTPLVMFFPGDYDGQYLQLFGKLTNNNYYRAFRLIP